MTSYLEAGRAGGVPSGAHPTDDPGHAPEDPVSHPHDDDARVEHDPTGMRDLLAALPDPGPMPADLVARIEAALADEVRGAAVPETGSVVPLRRGRSRAPRHPVESRGHRRGGGRSASPWAGPWPAACCPGPD